MIQTKFLMNFYQVSEDISEGWQFSSAAWRWLMKIIGEMRRINSSWCLSCLLIRNSVKLCHLGSLQRINLYLEAGDVRKHESNGSRKSMNLKMKYVNQMYLKGIVNEENI